MLSSTWSESRAPERTIDEGVAWTEAVGQLAAALPTTCREQVVAILRECDRSAPHGLKAWCAAIASGMARVPEALPEDLIAVYLAHPQAAPLHDCEQCGLAVPIIPGRAYGYEGEPARVFFPECPVCGGRTGWYYYWANGTCSPGSGGHAGVQRRAK